MQRGKLDVVADDGKQIYVTLNDGAVFGEVRPVVVVVVYALQGVPLCETMQTRLLTANYSVYRKTMPDFFFN